MAASVAGPRARRERRDRSALSGAHLRGSEAVDLGTGLAARVPIDAGARDLRVRPVALGDFRTDGGKVAIRILRLD